MIGEPANVMDFLNVSKSIHVDVEMSYQRVSELIDYIERMQSQLVARDALIERLVHYGNILAAMTFPNKKDDFENMQIKIWYSLREKWQAMKGGEE